MISNKNHRVMCRTRVSLTMVYYGLLLQNKKRENKFFSSHVSLCILLLDRNRPDHKTHVNSSITLYLERTCTLYSSLPSSLSLENKVELVRERCTSLDRTKHKRQSLVNHKELILSLHLICKDSTQEDQQHERAVLT